MQNTLQPPACNYKHRILVFPHFMNSCLSHCHQFPAPTEPCGVNPSQHLGQSTPPSQVPDTMQCAFNSRSSATTHVHPAPFPLLCQHSSVQPHAEPDGGTDPARSLPVCKRQRVVSQSGQARSPAHRAGVCGVPAPAHWHQTPAPQTNGCKYPANLNSRTWSPVCTTVNCSLALHESKVSPIRCISVNHNTTQGLDAVKRNVLLKEGSV